MIRFARYRLKMDRGRACPVGSSRKDPEHAYFGISTDSRTINRGEIFVALSGPNFDGHDYVEEVIAKGARS